MMPTTERLVDEAIHVRAVAVVLPNGVRTWTVIDKTYLPIEPIEGFLHARRAIGASPNTVAAYARHLSLYFRWLALRRVAWDEVCFEHLCSFMEALTAGEIPVRGGQAGSPRATSSVRAVMSAVEGLLEFWRLEGRGPKDLRLYKDSSHRAQMGPGVFMEHIQRRQPQRERRLKMPKAGSKPLEVLSDPHAIDRLLDAASTHRDQLLLLVMHDGALRIGQALGLRHEDLDQMRSRITVERRRDNVNGSLSKQPDTFTVKVPPRVFEVYRAYLLDELVPRGLDSDYVFVNLQSGRIGAPLSYSNARQVIQGIGRRAGVSINPHMLRHTHGTQLARAGWTNAEIAKRLGQSHASSADVYIHLVEGDIEAKFDATSSQIWGRKS
jgi:integrase/recombinase XerD